jgi:hypothetical protein
MSGFQSGVFNTTQNVPEINARSFADTILRRFPNGTAPLFGLTSKSGRTKAKSSTHGYFSKTMVFVTAQSQAALVGAASLVFPTTSGMSQFMVLHNVRTRENVRISAVTNGTTVAVERGFGRVAAAAVLANDLWIQAGTAFPEGSNRPVARRMTMVYVPNYTQIFRNAWALTDTARASMSEQGYSNVAESRQDCMAMHSTDIESALIFGQPKMDTTGAQPVHTTQGIIDSVSQYAPTHVNPAGSTTDYGQLATLVDFAFESTANIGSPTSRIVVGDTTAIRVIADIGRKSGQVQISQERSEFGHKYTSFQMQRGDLALMDHPLLNGLNVQGMAMILDMAAIKLAYMDGRDTKPEEYNTGGKVVENGVDAIGGSLTTEFAVELLNPFACAIITGLTAGVAET